MGCVTGARKKILNLGNNVFLAVFSSGLGFLSFAKFRKTKRLVYLISEWRWNAVELVFDSVVGLSSPSGASPPGETGQSVSTQAGSWSNRFSFSHFLHSEAV